jgi:hypothetical protein
VISGELVGEVAVAVRGGRTVEKDYCWVRGRGETVRSEWDGMGRCTGNRYPKLLYVGLVFFLSFTRLYGLYVGLV